MKEEMRKDIQNTLGSFINNHPFITMWIISDIVGIAKAVTHEIGKSARYRSYNKGYSVYANRLADLRELQQPIRPWDFEKSKKEETKEEEATNEEETTDDADDDVDPELDAEIDDIFSDDRGSGDRNGNGDRNPDDELHG